MKLCSLINNSNMPKFLKILIYILLTLTLVYWIVWFIYKVLDYLRIFLHFVSDKRNWWTFVGCIVILLIGTFLVAQFVLGLNPIGNFLEWLKSIVNAIRNNIGGAISAN